MSASYLKKKKKKTPRAKWFNKQIKTRVIYAREQQHDTLFTRKHIPCCLLLAAAGRECFFFSFLFIILADGQSLTSSWKRPRIWRTFSHRFVNGYEWNVDNLLLHFYKWIRHASSKRKSRRWKRNNIILQDLIIIFQMMDDIVQLLFFLLLSYSYTQFKWKEEKAIAAASSWSTHTVQCTFFSIYTPTSPLCVHVFTWLLLTR